MRSSRLRTAALVALSAIAVVVMVVSLWPGGDAPASNEERADRIAARLRCPFCNGESIADAPAQVARDLEVIIHEQVDAGMSDDEIFDYFADRYGESLLLDPPLLGWGWVLWVLPLTAFTVGVVAAVRRRRRPGGTRPSSRRGAEEALDAVARDRADVAAQVAEGELDRTRAGVLTAVLDDEEAVLRRALEEDVDGEAVGRDGRRLNRRVAAGAVALLLAGGAVVTTLVLTAREDEDRGIVDAPPIDLDSVSIEQLEEVVAANPDVTGMRVALAKLLTEAGEFGRAAEHFTAVLERVDDPEAMAWLGWISFVASASSTDPALTSELLQASERYLSDALSIVPDYPQAQWWLALVRFEGFDDPAGARELLEAVLASEGVPDDIRTEAERMLRVAVEAAS